MKLPNLKSLSFDDLVALRDGAMKMISEQASKQRQLLEEQLARLSGLMGGTPAKKRGRPAKSVSASARGGGARRGMKVAPKYRNPADRSQTWAGRGLRPKWLVAALKDGRSLEDFAIKGAAAAGAKRGAKKPGRKVGRPRKAA